MFRKSIAASLLLLAATACEHPSKVSLAQAKLELNVPEDQHWTVSTVEGTTMDRLTIKAFGLPIGVVDFDVIKTESPSSVSCLSLLLNLQEDLAKEFGPKLRVANKPAYLPATWSQDALEYAPENAEERYAWTCTVTPSGVLTARVMFSSSQRVPGFVREVLVEAARAGQAIPLTTMTMAEYAEAMK